MKAELRVGLDDQSRFNSLELLKPLGNVVLVHVAFRFRKRNVMFEMSRFRRQQARIKPSEFFRQPGRDFRKAFAGTRLDQCADQ